MEKIASYLKLVLSFVLELRFEQEREATWKARQGMHADNAIEKLLRSSSFRNWLRALSRSR